MNDATKKLAADHQGMRVDYTGLLGQCRRALRLNGHSARAEMLRQLQGHLKELGKRWYAGDAAVVDELLQLYCVEAGARAALKASLSCAAPATEGEREAFEAEVLRHIDPATSHISLARDDSDRYVDWGVMLAWEAWKGRARHAVANDTDDRVHAQAYLRQAEALLTGNEATLHAENEKLRAALATVSAPEPLTALRAVLSTGVAKDVLGKLAEGQGIETDDGKTWLRAAAVAASPFAAQAVAPDLAATRL